MLSLKVILIREDVPVEKLEELHKEILSAVEKAKGSKEFTVQPLAERTCAVMLHNFLTSALHPELPAFSRLF